MLKTRQKTIKFFEFEAGEDEQTYIDFISKNFPLLKYHTLAFKGEISTKLESFLQSLNLPFMYVGEALPESRTPKSTTTLKTDPSDDKSSLSAVSKTLFIEKIIRSGEEIIHNGDIIIDTKVNNGARIFSKGNLILLDECYGNVECEGEYLLCHKIFAPAILFQGVLIGESFLQTINQSNAQLKIIRKIDDDVIIKDLK
ncbi:septum site-determining protein MinC [Helicobacter sp. MIT 05-5293]|uniref:septum site-determining protein MinC n=1 Tax=Helicobacter sp. MIT 05-5293 TaxID=1548149 RepID=UPI00051D826E|nr:septum site-determining protein MinC [Helicobacter sp. MIT 05-5293]TLD79928.1 septum site-determining protein MinC [Helicobacter sp. MIT 05-5293]